MASRTDKESVELQTLYSKRFSGEEASRDAVWRVLCNNYFQRWVSSTDTVVEVAAGYCYFINNITAAHKIAVDLNPDVERLADPSVETFVGSAAEMTGVASASADVVFVSNFFEHLPRHVILEVLRETRRVLKPTGRLLILQPNIRFCAKDYWQFFDHVTALDDRSLAEALGLTGFDVELNVPRFIPFTMKSRLPSGTAFVRLYLKVPIAWRILGSQTFMIGRPTQ